MWVYIAGRIPSMLILINASLSLLLPIGIYKFNKALHKYGDPPWKNNNNNSK